MIGPIVPTEEWVDGEYGGWVAEERVRRDILAFIGSFSLSKKSKNGSLKRGIFYFKVFKKNH